MKTGFAMHEKMTVNNDEYVIVKLLGRGKGGYSYLAEKNAERFVLKQIHHEPCAYYSFGNKIEAELNDYKTLSATGIRIPRMYDVDVKNERIVKEYIEGKTVFDFVKEDACVDAYVSQAREFVKKAEKAGINIDWFPTNFVVRDGVIFYVDYECNAYREEWNFENWGIKYWSKTKEFLKYLEESGGS